MRYLAEKIDIIQYVEGFMGNIDIGNIIVDRLLKDPKDSQRAIIIDVVIMIMGII